MNLNEMNKINMQMFKYFVGCLLFTPIFCQAANCTDKLTPTTNIAAVGKYSSKFSNTNTDINYRYTATIWHAGACYFGYLAATESQDGEPARGYIDEAVYDPKSKTLRFSAKLSIAATSKDLFEFSGTLNQTNMQGTFTYRDKSSNAVAMKQKAILKLHESSMENMALIKTYDAWQKDAKDMMAINGPKW